MAIRIRKRIDSDTLHLPELRHLIGKVVDITVEEEGQNSPPRADDEFWNPPSLEEIARRQGHDLNKPVAFEDLLGSFTDEDFEGFDEWLEEIRRGPWRASDEDDS
jgi:hypothetical protein